MSTNPNEWKKFFESLLSTPLISGVCLYILSITVETLHNKGSINAADIGTWVLPLIRILGVLSFFLIFLGIICFVADLLKKVFLWGMTEWGRRSQHKREITRLTENVNRLSPIAKAMLQSYMQQPSGRFLTPEWSDELDDLITSDLIDGEDTGETGYGIYTINSSFAGKHYRVNPLYYEHIKKQAGRK